MGLFERRNLWSFKQLVEETKQPAMWLKEVLQEIATLNRRGPNAARARGRRTFGFSAPSDGGRAEGGGGK